MPSLPISSVEEIFARMSVTYGSAWAQMWIGIDPEEVKREWADTLSAFASRPEAIHHALAHLPVDRPPNVLQFKVICMHAPRSDAPELPGLLAPKPDISRLHSVFQRLRELRVELKKKPKQWAYDLQERERLGESLTEGQRLAWREALAKNSAVDDMEGLGGHFSLVENDRLPPGMRRDFGRGAR